MGSVPYCNTKCPKLTPKRAQKVDGHGFSSDIENTELVMKNLLQWEVSRTAKRSVPLQPASQPPKPKPFYSIRF